LNPKLFPAETAYCRRRAPLGEFILVWALHQGQPKIVQVLLAGPRSLPKKGFESVLLTTRAATCPEMTAIADQMEAFLDGAALSFPLEAFC
jgi:hypothetical protein